MRGAGTCINRNDQSGVANMSDIFLFLFAVSVTFNLYLIYKIVRMVNVLFKVDYMLRDVAEGRAKITSHGKRGWNVEKV